MPLILGLRDWWGGSSIRLRDTQRRQARMGMWNLSGLWSVLEIRGRRSDGMSLCYGPNLKPSQLKLTQRKQRHTGSFYRQVSFSFHSSTSFGHRPPPSSHILTMQELNSTVSELSSSPTNRLSSLGSKSKPTLAATY